MTTATPLTVDHLLAEIERFIVEVDAIASFDSILHGHNETWLEQHIYGLLDTFERATFGSLADGESEKLHQRGIDRGRELFREFVGAMEARDAR